MRRSSQAAQREQTRACSRCARTKMGPPARWSFAARTTGETVGIAFLTKPARVTNSGDFAAAKLTSLAEGKTAAKGAKSGKFRFRVTAYRQVRLTNGKPARSLAPCEPVWREAGTQPAYRAHAMEEIMGRCKI